MVGRAKGTSIEGLAQKRAVLRHSIAADRVNVLRFVAGHPGCTEVEVAVGCGLLLESTRQILRKAREVKPLSGGKWTLRHGRS